MAGQPTTEKYRTTVRGAILVFIIFHLAAITLWTVPLEGPVVMGMRELIRPYMNWVGLFQSWDTFAPNPKAINAYVKAVIFTKHHHIRIFNFPRMEELGLGDKYREERYRKFVENMLKNESSPLWPDLARHVARLENDPSDPPEKVMLIEYVSDIKPGSSDAASQTPRPLIFYDEYLDPPDVQ